MWWQLDGSRLIILNTVWTSDSSFELEAQDGLKPFHIFQLIPQAILTLVGKQPFIYTVAHSQMMFGKLYW